MWLVQLVEIAMKNCKNKNANREELSDLIPVHEPVFLKEKQVAKRVSMSVKWLHKCRDNGTGIPFHKFGKAVRYKIDDVLKYEAQQRRATIDWDHCNTTSRPRSDEAL